MAKFVTTTNNVNWTVVRYHVLSHKNDKVDIIIETNTNFANKWWFNCCQWGQVLRDFFINIDLFCFAMYTFFIFFLAIEESVIAFTFFDAEIESRALLEPLIWFYETILFQWNGWKRKITYYTQQESQYFFCPVHLKLQTKNISISYKRNLN